ncbi:MAG TPA: preprotein translocase subunit SecA [Pirellulales bacterium]|jgi:preprotein translocase subunit SecA|nr:preprotein translocase subunit SecA [Pirellulales bacterium]
MGVLQTVSQWRMSQWQGWLPRIGEFEPELIALTDAEVRKRSLSLRYRAKSLEPLEKLLPEAFALVREAGRRALNMRHFDVQLLGGIALHHRSIAEMQTGEGKTLTATLPLYLSALLGKGAILATVNDYLAKRDAEWMRPLYEALGLSVGVIQAQMSPDARRRAYACDVTYSTANELGFDFLRDRLLVRRREEGLTDFIGAMLGQTDSRAGDQPVQREPYFALVDEADSILIDEARTPLIISALPTDEEKTEVYTYQWSSRVASQFVEEQHYDYDPVKRSVELTRDGKRLVRALPKPPELDAVGVVTLYDFAERAIKAERAFMLNTQYVIRDGEIVIVDEFTGRLAEGRKWRDGLHQAIEAKEAVQVTVNTGTAARVTVQDFFQRFERLAGMTGTIANSAREMRKIYKLRVVSIPTNRPPVREQLPTRVFGNAEAKWRAVVAEVADLHAQGRPVLVGTRSIEKSEHLSQLLHDAGVAHQVLNARHVAAEAEIVASAGQIGRVTVSTNMAGRGTDIKLGDGVEEIGGLHVICTELHDSARIDRQLIGRCGRQGDPGTFRQCLSLDDEILVNGLSAERAKKLDALGADSERGFDRYQRYFWRAQRIVERRHFRDRRVLMYHEKERKKQHLAMGQDPYLDSPS